MVSGRLIPPPFPKKYAFSVIQRLYQDMGETLYMAIYYMAWVSGVERNKAGEEGAISVTHDAFGILGYTPGLLPIS